jgi:hypothetical protein
MQKSSTKKIQEEENLPPMRGKKKGLTFMKRQRGREVTRGDATGHASRLIKYHQSLLANQPSRLLLFILAKSGSERLGVENRILINPKSRTQPKTSLSSARSWKYEEQVTEQQMCSSAPASKVAQTPSDLTGRENLCAKFDRHTNLLAMEDMVETAHRRRIRSCHGMKYLAKSEESFMQKPNEKDTDVYLKYDQVP